MSGAGRSGGGRTAAWLAAYATAGWLIGQFAPRIAVMVGATVVLVVVTAMWLSDRAAKDRGLGLEKTGRGVGSPPVSSPPRLFRVVPPPPYDWEQEESA